MGVIVRGKRIISNFHGPVVRGLVASPLTTVHVERALTGATWQHYIGGRWAAAQGRGVARGRARLDTGLP